MAIFLGRSYSSLLDTNINKSFWLFQIFLYLILNLLGIKRHLLIKKKKITCFLINWGYFRDRWKTRILPKTWGYIQNSAYSYSVNNSTTLIKVIQPTFLGLHHTQYLILSASYRNLQFLFTINHVMCLGFLNYVNINLTLKTYKLVTS